MAATASSITLGPIQGAFESLTSEDHLHLALAQVYASDFDEEYASELTGFEKLKAYATKAAQDGADVVAFPEYFLTGAKIDTWNAIKTKGGPAPAALEGYRTSVSRSNSLSVAESEGEGQDEKHWIEEVCELAKELDINIIAGTVVELGHHVPTRQEVAADEDGNLHNTAYFIGREGEIRGRYTKRSLWHPERDPLTPGHSNTHPSPLLFTFTTRRGQTLKAGMQICWDLAFPESFRSLLQIDPETGATDGPDVVFVPTCWFSTDAGEPGLRWNPSPSGEAAILDALTMTRALECESILCMINIAARTWSSADDGKSAKELAEGTPIGVGRTTIVSPFVGSVGRLDGAEEGMLYASMNLKILRDIRDVYKIRVDLLASARG